MAMFQQIATHYGFVVDNDSTGQAFNSLNTLQGYDVIVFANTSGDSILDAIQKQNLEQFISGQKGFIGIHAASDTYRHSTANGTSTGGWDWYAEMLGASVQQNPSHVNGTPVYRIDEITQHILLDSIPSPWYKAEEYYYWEGGYFDSSNIVLQKVEQTVGPNSLVNSYDSARAMTWYRILPGGSRIFYTSLGHDVSNYTGDTTFYKLLRNAVFWVSGRTLSVPVVSEVLMFSVNPNPVKDRLIVTCIPFSMPGVLKVFTVEGRELGSWKCETAKTEINLVAYAPGIYFVELDAGGLKRQVKIAKE